MNSLISQLIPHLNKESQGIATQQSRKSDIDEANHQATPPERIDYSIAHALPGRVRFHVPRIAQDPAYLQRLEELLKADDWVTSVRVNRAAASVVITYKSETKLDSQMRLHSTKDSVSFGEEVGIEHLASLIQSATDTTVTTEASVAPTQLVTQNSTNSYFLPQSATQSTILTDSLEVKQDDISSKFEPSTIPVANSVSGSRVFLYEVVGLRQNEETDKMKYPIHHSGSVFIRVPFDRMNQEMRQIARLGGKIVSIQPLTFDS